MTTRNCRVPVGTRRQAHVYLHTWQVTGNEFFHTITEEILDYVMREMLCVDASVDTGQFPHTQELQREAASANDRQFRHTPKLQSSASGAAGFYSTQDADSEGKEGKFFVWTPAEIREVLGEEADAFLAAYGVTRHGNASTGSAHGFEGENILEFVGDLDRRPALTEARHKLFEAREERLHPGRDDVQLAQAPTAKQCRRPCRPHCRGPTPAGTRAGGGARRSVRLPRFCLPGAHH